MSAMPNALVPPFPPAAIKTAQEAIQQGQAAKTQSPHRDEGGTPGIEDLDDLGKIGERAGQPVDLVDNDGVDPPRREVSQQPLQTRPTHPRAGEPALIKSRAQAAPAFLPLALDEGLAGFTLRLQ